MAVSTRNMDSMKNHVRSMPRMNDERKVESTIAELRIKMRMIYASNEHERDRVSHLHCWRT
jgi:hypothetical protein